MPKGFPFIFILLFASLPAEAQTVQALSLSFGNRPVQYKAPESAGATQLIHPAFPKQVHIKYDHLKQHGSWLNGWSVQTLFGFQREKYRVISPQPGPHDIVLDVERNLRSYGLGLGYQIQYFPNITSSTSESLHGTSLILLPFLNAMLFKDPGLKYNQNGIKLNYEEQLLLVPVLSNYMAIQHSFKWTKLKGLVTGDLGLELYAGYSSNWYSGLNYRFGLGYQF